MPPTILSIPPSMLVVARKFQALAASRASVNDGGFFRVCCNCREAGGGGLGLLRNRYFFGFTI